MVLNGDPAVSLLLDVLSFECLQVKFYLQFKRIDACCLYFTDSHSTTWNFV